MSKACPSMDGAREDLADPEAPVPDPAVREHLEQRRPVALHPPAVDPAAEFSLAPAFRFPHRTSPKFPKIGLRATSRPAWATTCARPSRSGRLRPRPMLAAILAH